MGNHKKGDAIMNKAMFKMVIERAGYTQTSLAKELGISKNTLSNKVNGHTNITVKEVVEYCRILKIYDDKEKAQIFLN